MPRSDPQSAALFPVPPVDPAALPRPGRRRTGRHERKLEKALAEHRLDGVKHYAAASAARALACALDVAEAKRDPFATAQIAKPYAELLEKLGMIAPDDREGAEDDPLDGLGEATLGDASHT